MKEFFVKVWAWIKAAAKKVCEWIRSFDKWMGTDGLLCFSLSALMVIILGAVFFRTWWNAALIGFAVCLAKELYDAGHPESHTASWHELMSDLLGCLFGCVVILLYHL